LRSAGPRYRAVVILSGPLIWLVGLVAVSVVAREGDAIGIALAIAGVSFLIALLLVIPARMRRRRREREA
jgi:hypothetical protein